MLLQRRVSLLARAYSLPAYFYGSKIPYGGNTVNIHPFIYDRHISKEIQIIHANSLILHTFIYFQKSNNIMIVMYYFR